MLRPEVYPKVVAFCDSLLDSVCMRGDIKKGLYHVDERFEAEQEQLLARTVDKVPNDTDSRPFADLEDCELVVPGD